MIQSRRTFLRCLTGLIAAPAIVRADALMRVVTVDLRRAWRLEIANAWRQYDGMPGGSIYLDATKEEALATMRAYTKSGAFAQLAEIGGRFRAWETPPSLLPPRPILLRAAPQHGAEGGIAAGQRRLG